MKIHRVRAKAAPAANVEKRRRAQAATPGGAAGGRVPLRAVPTDLPVPTEDAQSRLAATEPGAADVRRRLLRFGMSNTFADRIVRLVLASGVKGAYAIDAAALAIGRAIPVQASPKRRGAPHVIAFVGPTGGGKTSTVAKIGRQLVASGRRVLFASLDPVGASALETVRNIGADVDRTEVPLVSVRNEHDLRRAMSRHSKVDAVLLDTPGLSPNGETDLDLLGRELEQISRRHASDCYLVLPATSSRSALGISIRAFARTRPTASVITKLDESGEPATAVEEAVRYRLPLAFLCDGQDVRSHVVRPTPDRLADLLLRGKVA